MHISSMAAADGEGMAVAEGEGETGDEGTAAEPEVSMGFAAEDNGLSAEVELLDGHSLDLLSCLATRVTTVENHQPELLSELKAIRACLESLQDDFSKLQRVAHRELEENSESAAHQSRRGVHDSVDNVPASCLGL